MAAKTDRNEDVGSGSTGGCRVVPVSKLIESALSRRAFVGVTVAGACAALMEGTGRAGEARRGTEGREELVRCTHPTELFQFANVPASQTDAVVVPEGYVAEVLYRWGDPVNGIGPAFKPDASNSAEDQARQAGMGHDGMEFFAIPGIDPNQRGLIAVNHEYTDQILLFPDGVIVDRPPAPMPLEKVRKSMASHGISVVEVARQADGRWSVVDSPRARRVTADTPVAIAGPAVELVGKATRGTVNNCSAGRTPWGTYLTCEENFQGVFGTNDAAWEPSADDQRYGLQKLGFSYSIGDEKVPAFRWWEHDPRFDLARPDNDSVRFGYVVEIDPQDPASKPVKRTALGRIRHENAEVTQAKDGRVVVYMGDDQAGEFIYKYVSRESYDPARPDQHGVASRGGLLDDGTLYVARLEDDGTGRWLALAPGQNGIPASESLASVCVRTRQAATFSGATPMDRPEWLAVHPHTNEVYVTLTNNNGRETLDPGNPRLKNIFGHILRWRETDDDPGALEFRWQVFILAGNPAHPEPTNHGNVAGDAFGCPDGLKFDASGVLWIQTDMSSSVIGKPGYAELGNNMMLAADPVSGEVRRFLTGPLGCEVTGIAFTPDRKTMFVNIQHPGEPDDDLSDPSNPEEISSWPDGRGFGRPRSATVVVRKLDGGVVGS